MRIRNTVGSILNQGQTLASEWILPQELARRPATLD